MNIWKCLVPAAFLAVLLLSGCASTGQNYENTAAKNLTIKLNMPEQGGLFTRLYAIASVYAVDANCRHNNLGFVDLEHGINKIGLEPNKQSYLLIQVVRDQHNKSNVIDSGTLITPVPGKQFEMNVSYTDGMFESVFYELGTAGKKRIPLVPYSACKG